MDLVYYGNQRQLEYDFVVRPGTDPDIIALSFEGADQLEVDAQGDLVLHAGGGEIRQRKPLIYQEVDGVRHEVAGSYKLKEVGASIYGRWIFGTTFHWFSAQSLSVLTHRPRNKSHLL